MQKSLSLICWELLCNFHMRIYEYCFCVARCCAASDGSDEIGQVAVKLRLRMQSTNRSEASFFQFEARETGNSFSCANNRKRSTRILGMDLKKFKKSLDEKFLLNLNFSLLPLRWNPNLLMAHLLYRAKCPPPP